MPGLGTSLLALTSPWQLPLMLEARAGSFPSHVEWGEDGCLLLPVPGGCRESWGWRQWEHSSGRQENAREMSERVGYGQQDRSESPVWAAQAGPAGLSLKSPRLDGSRMISGVWLSAGSHRGHTAAAQLPTREPGLAASRQGELERDAQGWKGTGRGWLISITPSSQARLGGRAWDSPSCPGAGAEKLPQLPGQGCCALPVPGCHALAAGPR